MCATGALPSSRVPSLYLFTRSPAKNYITLILKTNIHTCTEFFSPLTIIYAASCSLLIHVARQAGVGG